MKPAPNLAQTHYPRLSSIERMIFLKEVPFFQQLAVEQLRILVAVCEEQEAAADQRIIYQGEPGGTLYIIVAGQVGIERERETGSVARVATLNRYNYFGEVSLFDGGAYGASAFALQPTRMLTLNRIPLVALIRQYPDLGLVILSELSQRLQQAHRRITELTRVQPGQLVQLFDQLEAQQERPDAEPNAPRP